MSKTSFGFVFVNQEIESREELMHKLRAEADAIERGLIPLKQFAAELGGDICGQCKGYGKIRNWIAQNETRLEVCDRCKGTGMKASK